MLSKTYLHVDLDAFFASVEVLDNPELKGKPLIVGGLPGERRSVVSTCSYEARKYGVHSAMPVNRAYELCPNAVFVHGRMERYHEMSQKVMSVFSEYSPDVMQMSIDEAFIDITGTGLLFGDPVSLAKDLKKKVFERTGLTVSVGIASNRYVAKIASGLKKPDGLCFIPEGKEEEFMLSLPLDKLWGIGTRSRERLNACGIFTIPEIHAISETALKELFGEASGTFLYKSVRGMDVEHFGDETKSRSMSAERTFCFDLTDIYGIETELLHLSYDVMFRVLKAKVNSKTVCLKIRYEDFTTVTVTESGTRIVSSIEDLFERSCRLFHKKYERGRGIRLLGLGLQNISDGLDSSQGELFDFGEKKQRSVEKTVLKLHQKNPGTKLKKARQLIAPMAAFFMLLGALNAPAYGQSVEFDVEGSWESILSSGTTVVLGQAAPTLSIKPPVFSQKTDLLLWFMYDNHWYFDASVSTDSNQNTIAAGYEGDGIVREVRIGTDIGNDTMSPGIRSLFQGDTWDGSATIHLDSVQSHSKTWNGSSELVTTTISIADYKSGFLFAVPDTASASCITGLYIEDANGTYTDDSGRRYRRLSNDEYFVLPVKGLVYLEKEAAGAVLASVSDRTVLENTLPAFLKDTADWFSDRGNESLYYMMGLSCADETTGPSSPSETAPLFTNISGGNGTETGLYLSKPGTFSPFQVSSLYDTSVSENASISVNASQLTAAATPSILLEENRQLIQLYTTEAVSTSFSEAAVRFPAAKRLPETYLPSNGRTDGDFPQITATTAEASDSFVIGSSAIENTIQVLKNGIAVPAVYDRATGTVILSTGYSGNDTITILWDEYSEHSDSMMLTMAADLHTVPTPFLEASASVSSSLFFDPATRKLSSSPENEPSVQATLDAEWKRSFGSFTLSAANSLSAKALLPQDSQKAPLFTLSGTGTEAVWFLDGVKASEDIPRLTRRPSDSTSIIPVLAESERVQSFALSSSRQQGVSGYVWNIRGTLPQNNWYAAEIPLSSGASALPSAHEFSFTITNREISSQNYDVYLQLGEVTWLISASDSSVQQTDVLKTFIENNGSAQTVKVLLTDSDRLKLQSESVMRIILVNRDAVSSTVIEIELSGRADALNGLSFNKRAEHASGTQAALPVSVSESALPAPFTESGWFTPNETAHAACISWNTADASAGDRIIVDRSVPAVSLTRYRKVAVLLYVDDSYAASSLTVNLLKASDGGYSVSEAITVTEAELAASKGSWLTITKEMASDDTISRIETVIDACPATETGQAEIFIGGIFLLDPVASLTVSDEAAASVRWTENDMNAELAADTTGARTSAHASFASPLFSVSTHGSFDTDKAAFLSGEYLVSTGNALFSGIIALSENYRLNTVTDAEYRKDALSLSLVPLKIPFGIQATLETDRKAELVSGAASFRASSSYEAGETVITLTAHQWSASESSYSMLGSADARKRTESASLTQKLSFSEGLFTPSFDIAFLNVTPAEKSENTGSFSNKLTLPFTVDSNRVSFSWSRTASSEYTSNTPLSSYADDISAYVSAFNFCTDAQTVTNSGSAAWSRPLRTDLLDLIIPNAATFTAARTVSHSQNNVFDRKTASLLLSYTAFNCFGDASSAGVFSWYDQDEFQYSIKLSSSPHTLKTELTGYLSLYFINAASFSSFYSGTISAKDNYAHTFQFAWNRPAVLFEKDAERTTTGTFGIRKDKAAKPAVSNAGISHKAKVNISDIFSVTGSAGFNADIRDVTTLSITLSIGGKLQF